MSECTRDHFDGCLSETTWDEDDCTCGAAANPPRFATHVEAIDWRLERRLDGEDTT